MTLTNAETRIFNALNNDGIRMAVDQALNEAETLGQAIKTAVPNDPSMPYILYRKQQLELYAMLLDKVKS